MELINKTALVASLRVAPLEGARRLAHLVAKATFCMPFGAGAARLETQAPVPLFDAPTPTPLGLQPRDDLPRSDDAFEVVLLGAAHAPDGGPVRRMSVALSVGDTRRELAVFGDRIWSTGDGPPVISEARPFSTMPLTYERAFGGSCDVVVDRDAVVPVSDPRNPDGCGFDPRPDAAAIGLLLGAPDGYPVFDRVRRLPNVEDPAHLIARWDDAPGPVGFGPLPPTSALHAKRAMHIDLGDDGFAGEPRPGALHQAHPAWTIDTPRRGARVVLEGLTPAGHTAFPLPSLAVRADCIVGAGAGASAGHREARAIPHMLVLLPEERRFAIVYRLLLLFDFAAGEERAMRLRTITDWDGPATQGQTP